jgi:hypothetical protein
MVPEVSASLVVPSTQRLSRRHRRLRSRTNQFRGSATRRRSRRPGQCHLRQAESPRRSEAGPQSEAVAGSEPPAASWQSADDDRARRKPRRRHRKRVRATGQHQRQSDIQPTPKAQSVGPRRAPAAVVRRSRPAPRTGSPQPPQRSGPCDVRPPGQPQRRRKRRRCCAHRATLRDRRPLARRAQQGRGNDGADSHQHASLGAGIALLDESGERADAPTPSGRSVITHQSPSISLVVASWRVCACIPSQHGPTRNVLAGGNRATWCSR